MACEAEQQNFVNKTVALANAELEAALAEMELLICELENMPMAKASDPMFVDDAKVVCSWNIKCAKKMLKLLKVGAISADKARGMALSLRDSLVMAKRLSEL